MIAACAVAATLVAGSALTLSVHVLPHVPRGIVTHALEEAACVWKAAGVTLAWRIDDGSASPPAAAPADRLIVRVVFEDGPTRMQNRAGRIGWIVFEQTNDPIPEVHVSYSTALELLRLAFGDSRLRDMPGLQTSSFVSRAIGRALAHEIGHYLLRSKAHSQSGLMKAVHSTTDLFAADRGRFAVTEQERDVVLAALANLGPVARR